MRLRVLFALMPVLFVPACVATHALLVWREKTPVAGAPRGEFPILQLKASAVEIVPFQRRDVDATFFVAPADRARVLRQLDAQHVSDDANSIHSEVHFENTRMHVRLDHEVAMGYVRTESWYDASGKSIVPRFERQYFPPWMFLWACVVAIPVTLVLSLAAALVERLHLRAPPPPTTRAIIAAILYAVAVLQIGAAKPSVLAALPLTAAVAYLSARIRWTKWRQAAAIGGATAIVFVAGFFSAEIAGVAVLCTVAVVAFAVAAALIQRSLNYALTTAPTTS